MNIAKKISRNHSYAKSGSFDTIPALLGILDHYFLSFQRRYTVLAFACAVWFTLRSNTRTMAVSQCKMVQFSHSMQRTQHCSKNYLTQLFLFYFPLLFSSFIYLKKPNKEFRLQIMSFHCAGHGSHCTAHTPSSSFNSLPYLCTMLSQ